MKINGDYLDTRLKNTVEELSSYEPAFERLLDQIFDEYGILVCGWSGEWDVALKGAWERAPNRRFSCYWTGFGDLNESPRKLASLRNATVVPIQGADEFFQDLEGKLQALTDLNVGDVVSPRVAVARVKRYLADSKCQIQLHDLLVAETDRALARISGDEIRKVNDPIRTYGSALDTLLALAPVIGYWAKPAQFHSIASVLKRLAEREFADPSMRYWHDLLRLYQPIAVTYGIGLGAMAASNYELLREMLYLHVQVPGEREPREACRKINSRHAVGIEQQRTVFGGGHTPLSEHLFALLRAPLHDFLPSDREYEETFNWLEYLTSLCYCDCVSIGGDVNGHGPLGRFAKTERHSRIPRIDEETRLVAGYQTPRKVAAILRAGFFDSARTGTERYVKVKASFDNYLNKIRLDWDID
ncbi:MAG: hypothetical protein JNM66_01805 [Bryobacterales bacterium]|nr:hypothetical protein [Bryobacterales bacterium]